MEEKRYTAEEALNLQSSSYQKGYNEGYQLRKQEQPGAVWVKATRENMRRSAILRDSVLPENHIHQWVVSGWDEKGVKFTNRVEKEWWELEILDESGTAAVREEDGEKAQFNNWHRWLSENGYTYDGEYYYDQDNNYFTPDQLWAKFK